jgi:hypothetical protein
MRAPRILRDSDTGNSESKIESPKKKKATKKKGSKKSSCTRDGSGSLVCAAGAVRRRPARPGPQPPEPPLPTVDAGTAPAAAANVPGNTPGGQANPNLTPGMIAAIEKFREFVGGDAEARAVLELIEQFRAGKGDLTVPPIVAGSRDGPKGSTWTPGESPSNPTGLGPVTPQDDAGKPSKPWEANLADLPGVAGTPQGRAGRERNNKKNWLLGGGEMGTPNPGFTDKSGQAADGWTRDAGGSTGIIPFVDLSVAVEHDEHGNYRLRMGATLDGDGNHRGNYGIIDIKVTKDADVSTGTTSGDSEDIVVTPVAPTPVGSPHDPSKDPVPGEGYGRPRGGGLAQVVARFGGRIITCNIGGCVASVVQGGTIDPDRPDEGTGTSTTTTTTPGPGPSAATDPCPDCDSGRGGGGGRSNVGYRPQDESAGGPQGGGLGSEGSSPPVPGGPGTPSPPGGGAAAVK